MLCSVRNDKCCESCVMSQVHSRDQFWDWMKKVVLPGTFYEKFYDGREHDFLDGYSSDINVRTVYVL